VIKNLKCWYKMLGFIVLSVHLSTCQLARNRCRLHLTSIYIFKHIWSLVSTDFSVSVVMVFVPGLATLYRVWVFSLHICIQNSPTSDRQLEIYRPDREIVTDVYLSSRSRICGVFLPTLFKFSWCSPYVQGHLSLFLVA